METTDPKYKHKPSEKHTLEEVLKSLQDLIRNDLDDGAAAAGKPETAGSRPTDSAPAADRKSRHETAPKLREDFAPVAPGAGPVNLDAVLRSLKDLVGNELNVGSEPAATDARPASPHDEYLSTVEKIEEYIPEEPDRLDEELVIGDEPVTPEPSPVPGAPPEEYVPEEPGRIGGELVIGDESPSLAPSPGAWPETAAENLPQEFSPLDEELTFEEPAELPPAAPPVSATMELPGEISSELLAEPEPQPAPVPGSGPDTGPAPGTQQQLFLDEPPPIELRMPPAPETAPPPESAPEPETAVAPTVTAAEPVPEPAVETPAAPPMEATPSSNDGADEAMQALPTIEVEENADAGDYFDGAALSAEEMPATLEEIVIADAEIPVTPESLPPAADTSPAAPADTVPVPEPPAPAEKKITLEIAEPEGESRRQPSVDFDVIDLAPPPPDPAPPAAEAPPPEPEAPPPALAPDADTAPPPEPAKPPEPPPAMEVRADPPARAEPPPAPPEPAKTGAPESFSMEDIPVLNEVVAPPAGSVSAAAPAAPPLPAPDRARDLVVRAVAKLNVELRKSGGTGLDTKTILRLQQLIRQELEKGGGK